MHQNGWGVPQSNEEAIRLVGVRGLADRFAIRLVGQLRWPRCEPLSRFHLPTCIQCRAGGLKRLNFSGFRPVRFIVAL